MAELGFAVINNRVKHYGFMLISFGNTNVEGRHSKPRPISMDW